MIARISRNIFELQITSSAVMGVYTIRVCMQSIVGSKLFLPHHYHSHQSLNIISKKNFKWSSCLNWQSKILECNDYRVFVNFTVRTSFLSLSKCFLPQMGIHTSTVILINQLCLSWIKDFPNSHGYIPHSPTFTPIQSRRRRSRSFFLRATTLSLLPPFPSPPLHSTGVISHAQEISVKSC